MFGFLHLEKVQNCYFPTEILGSKSFFSLNVLKDSVDKNQNSWENKWNVSPASRILIRTLIWAHH